MTADTVLLATGVVGIGSGSGCGAELLVRWGGRAPSRLRSALLVVVALLVAGVVASRFADRPWLLPAYLLLAVVAVPLGAVDVAEHRIPDAIVKPVFALAVLLLGVDCARTQEFGSLIRAMLCAVAVYGAALVLILGSSEGMGWGDGKLLALSALWLGFLGWREVLEGLVLGFCFAALVAVGLVLRGRRGAHLPLAPFLLAGTLIAAVAAF